MIEFTVYRKDGIYRGIRCTGHAGYGEEGTDILCAAVSALVTNTVNSIDLLTDDLVEDVEAEEGILKCSFPEGLSDRGALLMESLLLGLKQIGEISDAETNESYLRLIIQEE